MSTFTNDIDMLNQALEQNVSQIVRTIITFTGSLAMMIFLSPTLTLVIAFMLVIMFFTIKFIGRKSSRNFRIQQHTLADINGYVEEMMSGQTVVKVFNYETRAIEEFNKNNENSVKPVPWRPHTVLCSCLSWEVCHIRSMHLCP